MKVAGTQGDVAYIPKLRTQLVDVATAPEFVSDHESRFRPFLEVAGPREESLVVLPSCSPPAAAAG